MAEIFFLRKTAHRCARMTLNVSKNKGSAPVATPLCLRHYDSEYEFTGGGELPPA